MASFRFLHCADLHLDSPLQGLEADAPAARIRDASRHAFSALVSYAIEQKIDFIVAAGDLYDQDWQDWRTGQFLIRELGRLDRAGIPFIAIRGNHDAENVITRRLEFPGTAKLLRASRPETYRIEHLNVAIHGQSFATRSVIENISRNYPAPEPGRFNIGLLHTNLDGNSKHHNYAPSRKEELAAHGYHYWALGHIHARAMTGPDPWIVYPGNIQGRHIRETDPKGAVLVTVIDDRISGEPHFIPFDTVRWVLVDVDVSEATDIDSALRIIRAPLQEALDGADGRLLCARVVLTGATAAHAALNKDPGDTRERVKAEAGSLATQDDLWIEDVVIGTRPSADRQPLDPALAHALAADPSTEILSKTADYARDLLDRVPGLRAALGDDHPAVTVADGQLPPDLIERARALLNAHLDT